MTWCSGDTSYFEDEIKRLQEENADLTRRLELAKKRLRQYRKREGDYQNQVRRLVRGQQDFLPYEEDRDR